MPLFFLPQPALRNEDELRACLKIVNTPNRRAFFRRAALLCLEIYKVFLRQIALPGEKIPCRWAYCQFSNGA